MADRILIYISAASDLMDEREALGKLIPEVPTSLGWRVVETPLDDREADLDAVVEADLHLLLLGSDVRAPVGLEWQVARRAGRRPVLLLKQDVLRTQAGEAFARELSRHADWHPFKDTLDLRRRASVLFVDHIIDQVDYYAILPEEIGRLREWKKESAKARSRPANETQGGAGKGGVILSAERFVPSQGKLIGQ